MVDDAMVNRILGVLSYVGMALVFGALAIRISRPEWDQYAIYAAWTGLALIVLYTLGQWREIVGYFKRRNARYGTIAGVGVLIVLGILIAVNYLSNQHNKRWDLTENRQYSLSDQTVRLLRDLDSPVRFLVFERAGNFDRYRTRLTEYEYHSNLVSVEYIDADQRPVQAREYDVDMYGTVIIEYMGRRERATSDQEQDLTNALIKVLDPQERMVYFLAGHGERDPGNTDRAGYGGIADALRRDNYMFETLVLAQTNEIPDDATVVVIAGPRTDLLEQEVEVLREYLEGGGKLLVLLDPPDNLKEPTRFSNLTALLGEWGIEATESVVVDLSGRTTVATVPVAAPPYPAHPITDRFGLITMFPLVRAIVPAEDAPPDRTARPVVQTAPRSWAETTLTTLEDPESLAPEPEQGDIPGPVSVAVAVSAPVTPRDPSEGRPEDQDTDDRQPETDPQQRLEARLVAVGDSDFASNAYLGIEGNRDLFMNMVSWLAQQEGLISIRPRDASDRRITLTASQTTSIFWLSIVVLPAAVLSAGVYAWWRRR
jgi:ABC-type uncharacterized transport system involved in gliding motility auxiliary subunit